MIILPEISKYMIFSNYSYKNFCLVTKPPKTYNGSHKKQKFDHVFHADWHIYFFFFQIKQPHCYITVCYKNATFTIRYWLEWSLFSVHEFYTSIWLLWCMRKNFTATKYLLQYWNSNYNFYFCLNNKWKYVTYETEYHINVYFHACYS